MKTQVQSQADNMRQALRDAIPNGRLSNRPTVKMTIRAGDWALIDHLLKRIADGELTPVEPRT